ncbi:hypothetical protein ZOSMA_86G00410 [Zostera marina]|uniref:Glycosyltransferase n=1 Tax=Zostera marina TaxID=29655 RepID=A0A0K9NKV8_ZOSMR|nr:hypothetical protein ZOSMA_86G00410 [Zostera marina]
MDRSSCESVADIADLRSQIAALSEKNAGLKKQASELNLKLRAAEKSKDEAEKQLLILSDKSPKAGPYGKVKSLRKNPTVVPDEYVNPILSKLLREISVEKEVMVTLANSNVKGTLSFFYENIKRIGIRNYLVVALDDQIESLCRSNGVPVYRRKKDEVFDFIGRKGDKHAISALKFQMLREFLQLGYSVLLTDADVVYLQNPFDHLHRDCDVESMSDGFDNVTAYGNLDVFDDESMGWSRHAHTMRIWAFNSGLFYIRPTIPSIELLDRATEILSEGNKWDQAVFNELLFFPSSPTYSGIHISKRVMDIYHFMNTKLLFKYLRHHKLITKIKPVAVHVNYHPDKLPRMRAIVDFYIHRRPDALKPFPNGFPMPPPPLLPSSSSAAV